MIVNLDTIVPDRLVCPEGKRRVEYVDKGGTGLYVEVRATSPGRGTYYLRWKQDGKTRHRKLGTTAAISLDEARDRAKKLKAEITLGIDSKTEKQEAISFHDFFQDHYLPHAKAHKRTWRDDSERYALRLRQAFGHLRLDQIKRHEVQSFHAALPDDGLSPASADHYVKLLRRCLNLAVEWDMLEKNPASGIKMFNPDNRRETYLNEEELRRLLKVLQNDTKSPVPCKIAMYLLATAARLRTALDCKWRDIDRTNRIWHIPASSSKSKRVHSVPLNDSALEVLDQLDTEGKYEHVFINHRTGKPYRTIHKAWERIRREAGLPTLRIHDLRHSAASYMAQAGVSLYVIQGVLNHSDPSVTQRYAHLSNDTLQEAANKTSDVIQRALEETA